MVIKTLKNLSVPDEKGCIFTRPEYQSWPFLLGENKTSLVGIDKRNKSRNELLNAALKYTIQIGLPELQINKAADIVVTGHQPEWHHCGILAKNIITDRFTRQTNGNAIQLVLDHDICHTSMSLPEPNKSNFLQFESISLERKQQNIPLEFRAVLSKEQLTKFIKSVSKVKDSFCSGIWHQDLHSVLKNVEVCKSVADIVTQFQAYLYLALGLEIIYLPVSLMSESDCFTDFMFSIICDAANFTGIYNKAISDRVKTLNLKPNQTVRSLETDDENKVFELPFWLISKIRKRTSLYVKFNNGSLYWGTRDNITGTIDTLGDKQQFLEILNKAECIIRPKAVTLTLFARLYLADWFVHGTGAANYEYITDYLIRHYYGMSKLYFGIATATMTLPIDINEAYLQRRNKISKKLINYRDFFFGLFSRQILVNFIK